MTKRVLTALLATTIVLVGCGGGDDGKSSLEVVQGAGAAVLSQETARLELRFEGAGQSFTMDGQIDFKRAAGSFTMEIPVLGEVNMVQDGTDLYIQAGDAGWTQITMSGDLAKQALQGFGADPRAMLEQMSDAEGIEDNGRVDVRGISTTHYSGTLDIERVLEAQGTPREQIDGILKQAGSVESVIDVYIDDDGLAHRTVAHTKLGALADIKMTMDMLDFGEPVSITVPDAAEVTQKLSASTQAELNALTQQVMLGSFSG